MSLNEQANALTLFQQYIKEHSNLSSDGVDDREIAVSLKSGRDQRELKIPIKSIQHYLDIDFAQYMFFQSYYGVVSYDAVYMEGTVDIVGGDLATNWALSEFFKQYESFDDAGDFINDAQNDAQIIRFVNESRENLKVVIGHPSSEFLMMLGARTDYDDFGFGYPLFELWQYLEDPDFFPRPKSPLTLKIKGVKIERLSQAEDLLRDISNACFFSLSRNFGINLQLRLTSLKRPRQQIKYPEGVLSGLAHKYSPEAMSLYRYGLANRDFPSLQFLAFYQVVEFFFEHFSLLELQGYIINELKDPRFSPYNVTLVHKLIHVIKDHPTYREPEQLKSILRATIRPREIVDWINVDESRTKFFQTGSMYKAVSDTPLDLRNPDNLISQLAARIYDIRCKIVHTKASGAGADFILPDSEKTVYLTYDVDLMREIAERVLIATSSELNF